MTNRNDTGHIDLGDFDLGKLKATAVFLRQASAPWSAPIRERIATIEAAIGALTKSIEEQATAIDLQLSELDSAMNAEMLSGLNAEGANGSH